MWFHLVPALVTLLTIPELPLKVSMNWIYVEFEESEKIGKNH